MPQSLTISSPSLSVGIATVGAELMSFKDSAGREWLWQGDPASWARRAPMLFPVVGRCGGGGVRHEGKLYPMASGHGYAPTSDFAVLSSDATSCTLRLDPSEGTRVHFPFDMRLDVAFTVAGNTLTQVATVTNLDKTVGVASVGFHPGFQWPLPPASDRAQEDHVVQFEKAETAPIRRIVSSRLTVDTFPNEIEGRILRLRPGLFAADAMVFDRPASRSVWFGVPGLPGVRADFPDCPQLGLWMRPGARYLCIEPWQGFHCPEDFDGDVMDKPGMVRLEPGAHYSRTMRMTIGAPQPG